MYQAIEKYGAILPCGGKGERLAEVTESKIPKPLVIVGEKELIRYSIDLLVPELVSQLVLAVNHGSDQIRRWAEEVTLPQEIKFSEQDQPGILAAVSSGFRLVEEESAVACNTDEVREGLDLLDIARFHSLHDRPVTMVVARADHLYRHRVVEIGANNLIKSTRLKPEEYRSKPGATGLVNTGFLIIDKNAQDFFDSSHSIDWSGIIDPLCDAGKINAYVDESIQFFNVGTVNEYTETLSFLREQP